MSTISTPSNADQQSTVKTGTTTVGDAQRKKEGKTASHVRGGKGGKRGGGRGGRGRGKGSVTTPKPAGMAPGSAPKLGITAVKEIAVGAGATAQDGGAQSGNSPIPIAYPVAGSGMAADGTKQQQPGTSASGGAGKATKHTRGERRKAKAAKALAAKTTTENKIKSSSANPSSHASTLPATGLGDDGIQPTDNDTKVVPLPEKKPPDAVELTTMLSADEQSAFEDRHGPIKNGTTRCGFALLRAEAELGVKILEAQAPAARIGYSGPGQYHRCGLRGGIFEPILDCDCALPPHVSLMSLGIEVDKKLYANLISRGASVIDIWLPLAVSGDVWGFKVYDNVLVLPVGPVPLTSLTTLLGYRSVKKGWFGSTPIDTCVLGTTHHGCVVRVTRAFGKTKDSAPEQPLYSKGRTPTFGTTETSGRKGLLWDTPSVSYRYVEELAAEASRRAGLKPVTPELQASIVTSVGQYALGFALPIRETAALVEHSVEVGLTRHVEARGRRYIGFFSSFVQRPWYGMNLGTVHQVNEVVGSFAPIVPVRPLMFTGVLGLTLARVMWHRVQLDQDHSEDGQPNPLWVGFSVLLKSVGRAMFPPLANNAPRLAMAVRPRGSWFWTVVLGPFLEEMVKTPEFWWNPCREFACSVFCGFPLCTVLFVAFEMYVRLRRGDSLSDRCQVALFHLAISWYPFPVRWALHAAWNCSAIGGGGGQRTGAVTHLQAMCGDVSDDFGIEDTCGETLSSGDFTMCAPGFGRFTRPLMPQHCRPGPLIRPVGFYVEAFPPSVNRACWHNELAAVATRVLRVTPWRRGVPIEGVAPDAMITRTWRTHRAGFQSRWLQKFLMTAGGRGLEASRWTQWIKHFPPFRRKLYEQYRDLRGMEEVTKRERRRKTFVKKELQCRHNPRVPEPKRHDPRAIQGAEESWSVRSALYLHAYTKLLSKVFHCRERWYYVSGSDAETVGGWAVWASSCIRAGGEVPLMVTIDAKRFDSSVTPPAAQSHHSLLAAVGMPQPIVRELRRREGMNEGKTSQGIGYEFECEVSSGHPDTSSEDSTISIHVLDSIDGLGPLNVGDETSILQEPDPSVPGSLGSPESPDLCTPADCLAAVNGDDNTVITHATWLANHGGIAGLSATYLRSGFDVTVSIAPYPNGDFCSQLFWPVIGDPGLVLGPKIGRTLGKTFWDFQDRPRARHARTVATGLQNTCSFVPILRAVVQRTLELTRGVRLLKASVKDVWKVRASSRHECDEQRAAVMMLERYGLTWCEVVALEAEIMAANTLPCPLRGPIYDVICSVDWELPT